jgi:hypothetical protein
MAGVFASGLEIHSASSIPSPLSDFGKNLPNPGQYPFPANLMKSHYVLLM